MIPPTILEVVDCPGQSGGMHDHIRVGEQE